MASTTTKALFAVAFLSLNSSLYAQKSAGLALGFTPPIGSLAKTASVGFSVSGFANIPLRRPSLFVRGELMYSELGYRYHIQGHTYAVAATTNLLYTGWGSSRIKPYILGGIGAYNNTGTYLRDQRSVVNFGVNGGLGVEKKLGSYSLLLETRYHRVFRDVAMEFVPITVGVRF
jgi:hypothetical protein